MTKVELKKPNGDVFLIAERTQNNEYIHAQWVGIQTLDTVMQGGTHYIKMLQEQPCPRLLNNHKELIGPWNVANDWIVQFWTPKVMELGLQYMSQVLAPGIYGQMSFHQLHQHIGDKFQIKMFEEVAPALDWLMQVGNENTIFSSGR
ncbi:hypothetical protein [Rufibacter latericius]|uniref:STAS/SEC14 domain-containing protein n=1 Tax=Rufibacter latericius TaxID=2487040 RepID=A0A3M9MV21_9BACT|nr:hypothetical protein [Rufibacter latericius]RNI29035.1 hypothetical protein EFB08_06275 [Rufibacter latericius]